MKSLSNIKAVLSAVIALFAYGGFVGNGFLSPPFGWNASTHEWIAFSLAVIIMVAYLVLDKDPKVEAANDGSAEN